MKVCAISDIHGSLIDIPKCEVLCICGDIFPLEIQRNRTESHEWFFSSFLPWAEACPCDRVFYIAGNHDFFFQFFNVKQYNSEKVIYLQDDYIKYNNRSFYGTPHCRQCGNWAFVHSQNELKDLFENIPKDVDVLLTHDAPFGLSDICLDFTSWNSYEHLGNKELMKAIIDKEPSYNFHGHLHSAEHSCITFAYTNIYNVSIKNEEYQINYNPLIIEI